MASYLENPNVQYNAPVQTAPLQSLVDVGMRKQALYNEGVQRIQSQIDETSALPVSRDVDVQYLNTSLANLGTELKKLNTADFSQMQVTNSVAGMTSKIAKDKNIQAAVYSTLHDQKNQADMEEDRKKGTLTPDNEFHYQKQKQEYLNSTDLGRQFNGKYVPNFDIFKFAKETFDAVKPDGYTIEQIYATNADGSIQVDKNKNPIYSPLMVTMTKEGRFPAKVKETLAQIFSDPRVSQQLNITGQYNYRNYDGESLVKLVEKRKNESLAAVKEKMAELNLQKNAGKDVSKEIETLQGVLNNKSTYYDQYKEIATTNPDSIRGALYTDDVNDRYTTMFGQMKEEHKTVENPGWNQNFKMLKEKNDQANNDRNYLLAKQKADSEEKWRMLDYQQKERLAILKKKGNGLLDDTKAEKDDIPGTYNPQSQVEDLVTTAVDSFATTADEFIYNTSFANLPSNKATFDRLMAKNPGDKAFVIKTMLDGTAKANGEDPISFRARWADKSATEYNLNSSTATPQMKNAYVETMEAKRQMEEITTMQSVAKKTVEAKLEEKYGKNSIINSITPIKGIVNGKELNLTKQDIYDLAIVTKGLGGGIGNEDLKKASNLALNRLTARGRDKETVNQLVTELTNGANRSFTQDSWQYSFGEGFKPTKIDLSSIASVASKIDSEQFKTESDEENKIYSKIFHLQPNLKMNIMPVKAEEAAAQKENIKRLATTYDDNNNNLSSDFKTFFKEMDSKGAIFEAHVIPSSKGGAPMVSISVGGSKISHGNMIITEDEAANIGVDVNKLYEPKQITSLKNIISSRNGWSSQEDPSKKSTYTSGHATFDSHLGDFPSLANSKYNVKVNYIQSSNGMYFPWAYITDGKRTVLQQLEGNENLQVSLETLKQIMTPGMAELALSQNSNK
ncbi:MAG: hypothetical protein WCP46_00015 [Alphaproteobacteria bacterium]